MLLGVIAPQILSAQTSTLPYAQTFENFSACIADCRFSCNMSEQWENASDDDTDWSIWFGKTSTQETGPTTDYEPGASWGKYLYLEASGGCAGGAEAHLISPTFDFSGVNQPIVSFAYHLYGLGQGSIHLDVDTSGSWTPDIIPPLHDHEDRWQLTQNCLPWLSNKTNVRFRIRGITGRTETSDLAIDAFEVYGAHAMDVIVQAILKDGCGLGSQEVISFEYANLGLNSLPSMQASYSIDNTAFTSPEMIPGGLGPCASDVFTFNQTADLSAPGRHTIKVVISSLAQDPVQKNDTLVRTVYTTPKISKFPYEDNFEHGTGHWTSGGENNSWTWGSPHGSWIQQAPHGRKAWFTSNSQGTYNNEEYSFLVSPCFDFSDLKSDPILTFEHTFQLERLLDSSWVEYSLNGGDTWSKIDQGFTAIDNWYNYSTEQVWSNTSAAGSGNWQTAAVELNGLAGETVRFRFVMFSDRSLRKEGIGIDRVRILMPHDVTVTAIETPYDTCGGFWGNAEPVRVRVWNKGYYDIRGLQMSYYVSGTSGFITPEMLPTKLNAGDSTSFTFQTPADISVLGHHFITVTAMLVNDDLPDDNSFTRSTANYPWATVNIGKDTVICKGELVKIKAFAPDATDFLWSDGSTGHAILAGTRGIHKLTVIDKNGCPGTDSMLLDLLPQPQLKVSFLEPVRCYGDSTGILSVQPYGSVPPYQFAWDNGSAVFQRSGLHAGHYPFTLTDQAGCTLHDSIEMKQSDSLRILLDDILPSGCPMDSSGFVDISVKGGTPPYSYHWSNGAMTEDLSRILDGEYSVFVSDAYGCSVFSDEYKVSVSDTLPKAKFSYRVTGGTVEIIDSSSNTVSHKYSFGDGSEPVEGRNIQYTYTENGTYKVKLIAENGCGKDTLVIEIQVDAVSNDNPELASVIKVGPNPVSDGFFFVHFQNPNLEEVQLNLFDISGKLCLQKDLQSVFQTTSRQIPVPANLPDGYYLVEINTHKGRLRQKLILQR